MARDMYALRLGADEKVEIETAAERLELPASTFIRRTAIATARRVIAEHDHQGEREGSYAPEHS